MDRLDLTTAQLEQMATRMEELESALSDARNLIRRRDADLHDAVSSLLDAAGLLLPAEATDGLRSQQLARRFRDFVGVAVPPGAAVLVVAEDTSRPLQVDGRKVWPFPQSDDSGPADSLPESSGAAIIHLEALRAQGAEYLLLSDSPRSWLERYPTFRQHIERRFRPVSEEVGVGTLYDVRSVGSLKEIPAKAAMDRLITEFQRRFGSDPSVFDWQTGLDLTATLPDYLVFSAPPSVDKTLPYADHSVDLVAIPATATESLEEARRVARFGVVLTTRAKTTTANDRLAVEWAYGEPPSPLPMTSIIIPTYNSLSYLEMCLHAVYETLPEDFRGEIIVVDDASTDETPQAVGRHVERDPRIRFIRNTQNLNFIDSCNQAAEVASGEILVFLNNDTVPLPGWLEALLRTFVDYPDAGAVGGKLVFPDGRLQEAGGVIFSDGSGANFGKWNPNPDAPLFNNVREVDYCSGALLATPRVLFQEIGGFDTRYRPAYFEDSDYGFRVRELGNRVYFQPESVAIHFGGKSYGSDVSTAGKRHRAINRAKFVDKWNQELEAQPVAPDCYDLPTLLSLSVRGDHQIGRESAPRALVCAPLLPEFDRESGGQSVLDIVLFLRELGFAVTYVAENGRTPGAQRYSRALQQHGVATYSGFGAQTDALIAHGQFDLAICAFWYIAAALGPKIRELSPSTRLIVNTMDLHFLRKAREAYSGAGAVDPDLAMQMTQELNTYTASDAVFAVSNKEANLLNDLLADPSLAYTVTDNEETAASTIPCSERSGILFVGNFRHPPNVEAAKFLCQSIVSNIDRAVLARHPISIVGNALDDTIRGFADGSPDIRMIGWVPSLRPYLEHARVVVVPLLNGAGTKRKLLQAFMVGTPAVSTTVGIEGFDVRNGEHVLVADDPDSFAAAVEELVQNDDLWLRLAEHGREVALAKYGREMVRQEFAHVITSVLAREAKSASRRRAKRQSTALYEHALPIEGPVQQTRAAVGIWADGWVGAELRLRVVAAAPIRAMTIEGWLPDVLDEVMPVQLDIDGETVDAVIGGGRFRWEVACTLPAGVEAELTLTAGRTLTRRETGVTDDERLRTFILERLVFTRVKAKRRDR